MVELLEIETAAAVPRILPSGWRQGAHENFLRNDGRNLSVGVSVERVDGKRWLHVSIAHARRMPTWDELREVKDWLIGRDRRAIQVLPAAAEHVNIHPFCLHLWSCLDGDGLPDFRRDGGL